MSRLALRLLFEPFVERVPSMGRKYLPISQVNWKKIVVVV
jgi:hypothetical protein